jgi:hypothetical protein
MPTANDVIATALTTSQMMLKRFLADLGPQEYLHRPTPKANCAAWIVGHLTLTDRNGLKRLGAAAPELPAGFDHQFSREEGCPQAGDFGDVSRLIPLFDENRGRLVEAVRAAPAEVLDRPIEPPHPMFATVAGSLAFLAMHTTMHAGQISIIRRSLGRPPLI